MRLVVALGGNALSPAGGAGTAAETRAALRKTSAVLADLVDDGAELVITHGNGPQIGAILLQQEYAADRVPPLPMDVCGAQSQGQLGYLIAQSLDSELRRRGSTRSVLCMLTQVVVDGRDPAFRRPTKPVGPSYDRPEATRIARETGYVFQVTSEGTWRRLVASPAPLRLVEAEPLLHVVASGHVVVAAGGGGVPVVEVEDGYRGVEAVVDKDLTAARMAELISADRLVLLTAVAGVQVGYGTPEAELLREVDSDRARELLEKGEFPTGSMGPKVTACVQFAESTGRPAVIAALADAAAAVRGDAGTTFVRAAARPA